MQEHPRNLPVPFDDLIAAWANLRSDSKYRKVFLEAAEATSKEDTVRNQSIKYLRQAALYQCAEAVLERGVPGDFVECGCFRGQSAYMLATLLRDAGMRPLHIFDSFEGLSDFGEKDVAGITRTKETESRMRRQFAVAKKAFEDRVAGFELIHIHAGWIPEKFDDVSDRTFALAHIDVDLYQPTKDSLEFLYPRLSPGGWIIVDDYNAVQYPGANAAVDEFVRTIEAGCAIPSQVGGFLICK